MSTEFYMSTPFFDDEVLIGRRISVTGGRTAFILQPYEPRITSWNDWRMCLYFLAEQVRDEYGKTYTVEEFERIIENASSVGCANSG